MKNIKIIYQYDGSKYYGFQRQPDKITVQGDIEKVLKNKFNENINLISSGRTDRGVHAIGQVSNFELHNPIPIEIIKKQINKSLFGKIKIHEIHEIEDTFHSRYDAVSREYLYVMKKSEKISVFEASYVSSINYAIDEEKFQKILDNLIGKHDFSSFMKTDKVYHNPVREIFNVKVICNQEKSEYTVRIIGDSFLKSMVRIIIGSALLIYTSKENENFILNRLQNPDINVIKTLASSEGLYLYKVNY